MTLEPEIWREIAVYFLATVFAYALGIAATVALAPTVRTIATPSAPKSTATAEFDPRERANCRLRGQSQKISV
jgi:hypothetical protein